MTTTVMRAYTAMNQFRMASSSVRQAIAMACLGLATTTGATLPAQSTGASPAAIAVASTTAGDITANDNRAPTGVLAGKTLRVRLEVVRGNWRPDGQDGPVRDVYAFATEGGTPSVPGPLLRVPEGTELQVTVRNRITKTVRVHGLVTRPSATDDPTEIMPGAVQEFRFRAGTPGTFYYWAATSDSAFTDRTGDDSQLTGALIVDSPTTAGATDRVFVIGEWQGPLTRPGTPRKISLVINGRSWPGTERLTIPFGLPVEWRLINGSVAVHPMHLHGTFYTVESRGTALRDEIYSTEDRRLVTTELMDPGSTMMMRWVPDRVGNWLFHCHLLAHVTGRMRDGDAGGSQAADDVHAEHDPQRAMAGLVLGIILQPGDETAAPDLETHVRRRMTLHVRQRLNRYGANPGYGFSLVSGSAPAPATLPADSLSPPIILTKGEPVTIGVANAINDAIAIHWHGIELESFNDGVPGWSGESGQIMPAVEPGKTFDVNFTPPRAGTFIYHTHGHDSRQLVSGMYGALIVLEPGATFDPESDHIVLIGGNGPGTTALEMNRSTNPPPMLLKAGIRHRFRIINISTNFTPTVTLRGPAGLVQWRALAKDGADLPPNQATKRPASLRISIGETYDYEFEPAAPGDYRLEVLRGGFLTSALVRVVK